MRYVKSPEGIKFDTNALLLARLRAGLTQEGLARRLDISTRQYQRWENSEGVPSGVNLLRLVELLDLSTADLYVTEETAA